MFNNLRELLNDGIRTADDDVVHLTQFVIAHLAPKRAGADSGPAHLHFERLTRLVARRVIVLARPPRSVILSPHELASELDGLLVGIGDQGA